MSDFDLGLPFLTREMLRFQQATTFAVRITSISAITGTVTIRGATRSGMFTLRHTLTANDTEATEDFAVPDVPIWLTASLSATGNAKGEVYVRAGLAINGNVGVNYFGGYLYDTRTLDWPHAKLDEPMPNNMGRFRVISDAVIAAGTDPFISGSLSRLSKIRFCVASLTTSAAVANRTVHFTAGIGGSANLNFISSVAQTASTTRIYTIAPLPSAGVYSDDNDIIIPIPPDLIAYDEFDIRMSTTNLQAGDQWNYFNVGLEQWIYAGTF